MEVAVLKHALGNPAPRIPSSSIPSTRLLAVLMLSCSMALGANPSDAAVDATVTTDNAYSFGYGPLSGPTSLIGGVENCTAGQIFNCVGGPETYLGVPSGPGQYLYLVAYSDGSVTQGTLGQFIDGSTVVLTGNLNWEVYATGQNLNPNCGGPSNAPSLAAVNAQVALANAGSGGANSSVGWVNTLGGATGTVGALAIGEENNSASGHYPIVCNIASGARWMWYTPNPVTITDPFRTGSPPNLPSDANEYLIFRLTSELPTAAHTSTWGRVKTLYR